MLTAGATVLAVSGFLLTAPPAANASGLHICAVPQSGDCIDAPNLDSYTHVVGGSPGRDMVVFNLTGNQVELQFVRDQTMCVAAENDGVKVDIKPCFGSDGVVWYLTTDPNDLTKFRFENREFRGSYLTGMGNGSQFIILPGTPIQDFVFR
jgi:hypothetical protein